MDAIFIGFKKEGISSNQFIQNLKKKLNVNKIGHAGTLDPFATGLLIIGTDNYTKLLTYFNNLDKTYLGTFLFGKETDTLDKTGKLIREDKIEVDFSLLKKIISDNFIGKIAQIPPLYSATKWKGLPAYKYALKNIDLNLEAKERFIYSFQIYQTDKKNQFDFKIKVSSGTYIRAIARDLGQKLQISAILLNLKRIKIANLEIKKEENEIEKINDPYQFLNFKKVLLNQEEIKNILNGKEIEILAKKEQILLATDQNNKHEILISKITENIYKIKKRIR
ncbi:MAG: tRNA pseudouridine synthase B [Candidatus Hepatoplasma scabrum]|nr:MAG: tRNA pseudouridine synthase B [Candidatus Hepatoplasma sp.]